ncbi:MAG: hypothetical protein KAR35_05890, partial [Candidatus Heimdallarchaeota archaeon]|nr:hypothetical protein [Candidatus Heimdallarchaeota archaeon]
LFKEGKVVFFLSARESLTAFCELVFQSTSQRTLAQLTYLAQSEEKPIYFFIDGYDELEKNTREQLFSVLFDQFSSQPHCSVIMTSRGYGWEECPIRNKMFNLYTNQLFQPDPSIMQSYRLWDLSAEEMKEIIEKRGLPAETKEVLEEYVKSPLWLRFIAEYYHKNEKLPVRNEFSLIQTFCKRMQIGSIEIEFLGKMVFANLKYEYILNTETPLFVIRPGDLFTMIHLLSTGALHYILLDDQAYIKFALEPLAMYALTIYWGTKWEEKARKEETWELPLSIVLDTKIMKRVNTLLEEKIAKLQEFMFEVVKTKLVRYGHLEDEVENLFECMGFQRSEFQKLEESQRAEDHRLDGLRGEEVKTAVQKAEDFRLEVQKFNELKLEEFRDEEVKTAAQRAEAFRLEVQKFNELKFEEFRVEELRMEVQDLEEVRLEAQTLDESHRADNLKLDWLRAEEFKTGSLKLDAFRVDVQDLNELRLEELRIEELRLEELRVEELRLEVQRLEELRMKVQSLEESHIAESLRLERLRAEELRKEAHRAEDFKLEVQNLYKMKKEIQRTEELKLKELKGEELRTEELRLGELRQEFQRLEESHKAENLKLGELRLEELRKEAHRAEDFKLEIQRLSELKKESHREEELRLQELKNKELRLEELRLDDFRLEIQRLKEVHREEELILERLRAEELKKESHRAESLRLDILKLKESHRAEELNLKRLRGEELRKESQVVKAFKTKVQKLRASHRTEELRTKLNSLKELRMESQRKYKEEIAQLMTKDED